MGIELMVSFWPFVDVKSENYEEMLEKGYLIRTERGVRIGNLFCGNTIPYDATNPERANTFGKR
jgi:alpha-D-xyloside xylohydrolase